MLYSLALIIKKFCCHQRKHWSLLNRQNCRLNQQCISIFSIQTIYLCPSTYTTREKYETKRTFNYHMLQTNRGYAIYRNNPSFMSIIQTIRKTSLVNICPNVNRIYGIVNSTDVLFSNAISDRLTFVIKNKSQCYTKE